MKKQLVLLAVTGAFALNGWAAETSRETNRASKKEIAGLGSGAAIGAAAGGPVGLIIGAAFGAWLGDRFQQEQDQREELAMRYDEARTEITALEGTVLRGERETARLESMLLAEQRAHRNSLQEAIDIQVLFRTNDTTLEPDAEERLARIGRLIAPMDGVIVRLAGHTDGRGDEEFNLELSEQRAAAVRDVLVVAGVAPERIVMSGEGKRHASAEVTDLDAMALERRVHIQLVTERDGGNRVARY
jgi:outer membrane protein OmpA-like peptidoglycan-associated protein